MPLEIEQALFRIVQEAFANVTRHSEADEAEIRLIYAEERIRLSISDNGCGFDTGEAGKGFGLSSMQQRANKLGGNMALESIPDSGTSLTFSLPLSEPKTNGRGGDT